MIDAEMYGMMPSAKIDKRSSAPPENMLNMLRIVPRLLLEQLLQRDRVDARHRDERADAVDDQRAEQEQQALAEIGETRRVAEQCSRIDRCLLASPCSVTYSIDLAAGGFDDLARAGA